MGYLYAIISVLLGNAKGYCGKKNSGYLRNDRDAVLVNAGRMLLCTVFGFFIALAGGVSFAMEEGELWIFLLSAVSSALFVVFWLLCAKTGAYLMLDVFLLLGTVLPIGVGVVWFDETLRWSQIAGIGVLLAAAYMMYGYNFSLKGKMTAKGVVILALCGIASGCADLSQKLYVKTAGSVSAAKFNFYTYLFAFAILLAGYVLMKKPPAEDRRLEKRVFLYVLIMALCLFGCSYFKTLAARTVDSARLYPLTHGLSLINSTLMAVLFFRERPDRQAVIGVVLAFAGLMLLNL